MHILQDENGFIAFLLSFLWKSFWKFFGCIYYVFKECWWQLRVAVFLLPLLRLRMSECDKYLATFKSTQIRRLRRHYIIKYASAVEHVLKQNNGSFSYFWIISMSNSNCEIYVFDIVSAIFYISSFHNQ